MLSAAAVRQAALDSGFTLVGLTPAAPLEPAPLRRWLDRGAAAGMAWMAQRAQERLDPGRLLPGCRTVAALAVCGRTAAHRDCSPLALFAQGRDYHATLLDRLRALRRRLKALAPGLRTWSAVDTGPVMERVWAARAGLGWVGRSGMLVNRQHGTALLLATLLLEEDCDGWDAPAADGCGSCHACLKACPTAAIDAERQVDSRRCLSYWTIETRGPWPEALREAAGPLAFGCDLCQRACPWNRPGHACDDPRFVPRPIAGLTLLELAGLAPERWRELTRGTAVVRAGYQGLRRNALIALGAARDPAVRALAPLAEDPDAAVREAARWALARADTAPPES